jgi:CubicO group peptidase (beta-lactamase class C family)
MNGPVHSISLAGLIGLIAVLGCNAWAADPPRANPEELGFSAERLDRIDRSYADKVERGEMAGIVTLVARHGRIAHFSAVGYADTASRRVMRTDDIFRLYSMTKPIAATALTMLYEEGKFRLDDPISKYIPEFAGIRVLKTPDSNITDTVPAGREPTIHDLFRHTAGFLHGPRMPEPRADSIDEAYRKADLSSSGISLEEMTRRLARIPLAHQPGTRWHYSLAPDVQARLVEILSGMPFDQFLEERLFAPLGMKDTSHRVSADGASRLVPVHWKKNGQVVPCGETHGCSVRALGDPEINTYTQDKVLKRGSSGLTGTAEDYWRFAQMMLNGGELNGHRFLSPVTVRHVARDHLGEVSVRNGTGESIGTGWGLGFAVVKDAAAAAALIPDGSYYWAGAANTFFWIDPANDIVVVAMTQSMDPEMAGWPALREQLGAMVYGALME